jgi:hypothetical protein
MQQTKKWPMLSLSVMEWEDPTTKDGFREYVRKYYPATDAEDVVKEVENWLQALKKRPKD